MRHLFQAAHRQDIADHRGLEDDRLGGVGAVDPDVRYPRRQGRAQGVHLPHDLVVFPVGIGVPGELRTEQRGPVVAGRADERDIVEPVDGVFDRLDHLLFDFRRGRPGQGRADVDRRDRELGIFRTGDRRQRAQAQGGQQRASHQGELPAADKEGGGIELQDAGSGRGAAGALAIAVTRSPSLTKPAPAVISRVPGGRPDTRASSPSKPCSVTAVRRATPGGSSR